MKHMQVHYISEYVFFFCLFVLYCVILFDFFNWLFIVALTARSYRECHWFSILGMVLY